MAHHTCLIGECGLEAKARGLCNKHYQYARANGTLEPFPPLGKAKRPQTSCAVDGCERTATATVYCHMHYLRLWKGGEVGPAEPQIARIKGTVEQRFWFRVEKTDSCWNWVGARGKHGYGTFWNGSRNTRVHRYAYELLVGPIPEGLMLDHLCRNRSCVNPDHLEAVTARENVLRGESPVALRVRAANARKDAISRA